MTGAMGLSFKRRNEEGLGKTIQKGGNKAGGALSLAFPCESSVVIPREPLRPPQPWPNAEQGAPTSSFLILKESLMAHMVSAVPGL